MEYATIMCSLNLLWLRFDCRLSFGNFFLAFYVCNTFQERLRHFMDLGLAMKWGKQYCIFKHVMLTGNNLIHIWYWSGIHDQAENPQSLIYTSAMNINSN